MIKIELLVPDNFTEDQIAFIKKSAILQVESEIKKELFIPKEQIDAVEVKISEIKEAMGIVEKPVEPIL